MGRSVERIHRRDEMRILFIEPYPIEGPSSRYRVEQYIPCFRSMGIHCHVRPFVSPGFYKILYKKGHCFKKILFFISSALHRAIDIFIALRSDIVFIHLEAFPFGPPIFEKAVSLLGKKIIYDLDDAIYLGLTSPANTLIRFLKNPSKISKIIKMSDHVITCNVYLKNYAKKYNDNVTVIHTALDTEKFSPGKDITNDRLVIGWIGSHSTAHYLDELKEVFSKLGKLYKFDIKIVGAGDYKLNISGVNGINKIWDLNTEIEEFRSIDIGVYPLPDNEWTRGKTGFKTIQYMSVGVPCVVSNVGANKEIVQDGLNGYLANREEDWVSKLSILLESEAIRKKIGYAGRKTVEENFSIKINAPIYLEIIKKVCNEGT